MKYLKRLLITLLFAVISTLLLMSCKKKVKHDTSPSPTIEQGTDTVKVGTGTDTIKAGTNQTVYLSETANLVMV